MITGTIFCYNAIKFDYPIIQAINSLLPFCEEVLVLDCFSTDGTTQLLLDSFKGNLKVKIYYNKWEQGTNYDRLAIHANFLIDKIKTPYHFMLQADEVVHESSIPYIQEAVKEGVTATMNTRYNLWGHPDYYIKLDSPKKPCGDTICRLAVKEQKALRDAESLDFGLTRHDYTEKINIIHYGFVRRGVNLIDKIIDMQSWFFGVGSTPDAQVVAQKEKDYIFDSGTFYSKDHLAKLPFEHPKVVQEWVNERKLDNTYRRIINE